MEQSQVRDEGDTIDPRTGIPSKWAAWLRATNEDGSVGVGLPDVGETALSDGLCTLPGTELASNSENAVGFAPGAVAAAASSSSEHRATTSTDRSADKKQTNLKGWLK